MVNWNIPYRLGKYSVFVFKDCWWCKSLLIKVVGILRGFSRVRLGKGQDQGLGMIHYCNDFKFQEVMLGYSSQDNDLVKYLHLWLRNYRHFITRTPVCLVCTTSVLRIKHYNSSKCLQSPLFRGNPSTRWSVPFTNIVVTVLVSRVSHRFFPNLELE